MISQLQGRGDLIRYDVIHVVCPTGARIAEPHDLNGSWLESKNLVPGSLGVAIHVDQYVDAILIDAISSLAIVK